MDSLAVSVPVFLATAVVVVIAGVFLARYGDEIAERTGWGTLWVGTILVSVATSLPELMTNISAVAIEDAPALALGNIFGADMINVFVVSLVAMIFGVRNIFGDQTRDVEVLIFVGMGLVVLGIALGLIGGVALWWTSLGSLVILAAYFFGMKLVYDAGRSAAAEIEDPDDTDDVVVPATGSVRSSFIGFGLAALAVIIAAPFLAASADGIAAATGLGQGFVGILGVSIVTTLPETSVTIAAARRRSYGLVLGNIFGSNAFNISIIFWADWGNSEALLSFMEGEHFVAAAAAFLLMVASFGIIRSFKDKALASLQYLVYAIPPFYIGMLYWVYLLSSE